MNGESETEKLCLTLVSSWALARLSTAIAKNTFSSVSESTGLRNNRQDLCFAKFVIDPVESGKF